MDLVAIAQTVANAAIAVTAADPAVTTTTVASSAVNYAPLGAGLAAGLAVLGAALSIGKLASAALEGSARQPEMQAKLQTMMILGIAFVEALALIALMVFPFLVK
jgi:F-type H+-transporting ATPase subunit c